MEKAGFFGARLKELRAKAKLTLAALAEKAGVSMDAIVKWEAGNRKPTWEAAVALSDALGVKLDDFTTRPTGEATRGRGRPRKPKEESPEPKKRGRPPTKKATATKAGRPKKSKKQS